MDAKGERKLTKSVRREERADRGRSNASQTVIRGDTDNRRGQQGTWKKKSKNLNLAAQTRTWNKTSW